MALAPAHITQRLRRAVGLPDRDGVLVRVVETGSPGDRAGLQAGDLLTRVGETDVASVDDVAAALDRVAADATVQIHLLRGTDELDIEVDFTPPSDEDDASA